ncbi:ABC transporter permease [uncultured Alsobacter sp.]|uniref:ABC transporter permease n=1 Tax=uncultured Alsobacter sp. TaxID=1748258 RepID=UPI0025E2CB8E|nr:ABC transporter permease [uncultured Alsobacter sp.]
MSEGTRTAPAVRRLAAQPFGRFWAMLVKEFIQLRRDRVTLATMVSVPLMQLLLFGFAINTTPRHMPAAILLQEQTDVSRSILAALQNTSFFDFRRVARTEEEVDAALRSGEVLFAVEIPAGFEKAVRRGETPALLFIADATDPVASASALGALNEVTRTALAGDRFAAGTASAPPFEIRQHRRFNPSGSSQLNIVPGLLGTILTMTLLIFTALSVTREVERGTMENLLSMPIRPTEIMMGKIAPYIVVGLLQAALIMGAGVFVFGVPMVGSLALLTAISTVFIATNLSIGYTFSTLAQNQLQAMQMAMMFFLPNILLSGFMFPFSGMPTWAQWVGEALPLTHFLRVVRGVMLKGSGPADVVRELAFLMGLMGIAMTIAVTRFRQTLD